jgi:Lsr2
VTRRVTERLVDAFDSTSTEDVRTVTFGLDGVFYEIDLTPRNAERLRKHFREFIPHARKIARGSTRGDGSVRRKRKARTEKMKMIREWARANGHYLAERGRMPTRVVEEFHRAQKP